MGLNKKIIKQYWIRNKKLRSLGIKDYSEYLNSPYWKLINLKWKKKIASGNLFWSQCNCCNTKENLILHHIRYGKITKTCLNAVVPLCLRCHHEVHKIAHNPEYKGSLKEATRYWRHCILEESRQSGERRLSL